MASTWSGEDSEELKEFLKFLGFSSQYGNGWMDREAPSEHHYHYGFCLQSYMQRKLGERWFEIYHAFDLSVVYDGASIKVMDKAMKYYRKFEVIAESGANDNRI